VHLCSRVQPLESIVHVIPASIDNGNLAVARTTEPGDVTFDDAMSVRSAFLSSTEAQNIVLCPARADQ